MLMKISTILYIVNIIMISRVSKLCDDICLQGSMHEASRIYGYRKSCSISLEYCSRLLLARLAVCQLNEGVV